MREKIKEKISNGRQLAAFKQAAPYTTIGIVKYPQDGPNSQGYTNKLISIRVRRCDTYTTGKGYSKVGKSWVSDQQQQISKKLILNLTYSSFDSFQSSV
jgi:hypothetical protein